MAFFAGFIGRKLSRQSRNSAGK